MLYASLVFSATLLAAALGTIRKKGASITPTILCAIGLPLSSIIVGVIFPAVVLQAVLLLVAAAVWSANGWAPGRFALSAVAATLAAYGVVGGFAAYDVAQLQQQFPYVSMEARLPRFPAQQLVQARAERLDHVEMLLEESEPVSWSGKMRVEHLKQLHEHTVDAFANRPGFGVGRMFRPSGSTLKRGLREEQSLPQPGDRVTVLWSTGDLELHPRSLPEAEQQESWEMHARGLSDFVNLRGFGYVRDRRHVAGFQSHQFSQAPAVSTQWVLHTIDLIGLVQHDQPVAYVSDHLPRMEELRDAPRRPLDDFESLGLEDLRNGQDIFSRAGAGGRRLLGAIRNTKQCLTCHGGERGDLLGAFSYTLTPAH